MGNGYLYYQPEPDAGWETVDLGEGFGSLDDQSEPQGAKTRGLGGQVFPTSLGRFDRIRATRNGIATVATAYALRSFEAYAESGAPFGLSLDHAKTWAGYCQRIRLRGETSIQTTPFSSAYSSSGTIAANDYVVIESGYPEFKWEIGKVSTFSSNTITLTAGLKRSYRQTPLLVRWIGFWPFLSAEASGPMVTTTTGVVWDFAVEATTIAGANPAAFSLSQILETGTGSTKSGGKATLNDLLGKQAADDGLGVRGGGNIGSVSLTRR